MPGCDQERIRWRQTEEDGPHQVLSRVQIPKLAEVYYSAASAVDRHNRVRQADLNIEKSVRVKEWSFRINSSLLAVCFTDAWIAQKQGVGSRLKHDCNSFFTILVHELIDNEFDTKGVDTSTVPSPIRRQEDRSRQNTNTQLIPTAKVRKRRNGDAKSFRMQRNCKICSMKTKWTCSTCEVETFLCHMQTGRNCFDAHCDRNH